MPAEEPASSKNEVLPPRGRHTGERQYLHVGGQSVSVPPGDGDCIDETLAFARVAVNDGVILALTFARVT